jgi:ornithine carbamoyltransferase
MKKDLLKLLDLSSNDIERLLDTADQMKFNQHHNIPHRYLEGKTVVMIFEKNSTRTRVSFETGIYQLGGHGLYLSGKESQIVRGEAIEDTARTLARYCDAVVIRTYDQKEVEALASYAQIPVINGMTDLSHPCQVLADLMTVRENYARLDGLNACYIGDGDNMCNSLIVGCLKSGMNMRVACPVGYEPAQEVLDFAASVEGPTFQLTRDPKEAAQDADVIFTDVWISQGKEEETAQRLAAFQGYQVNEDLMTVAHPGCMVQHCLPANRGQEITAELFEAHADQIFDETENRLHVQKAALFLLLGGDRDRS